MVNNLSIKKQVYSLHRPYSYVSTSLRSRVIIMLVLLSLQLLLLAIDKSFMSLIIVLVATASSVLSTFISNSLNKWLYNDKTPRNLILVQYLTSITQGVIIGLLTPASINIATLFVVTLFVMLIAKWLFGGFSQSPANVCALTVVFLNLVSGDTFLKVLIPGVHNLATFIENGNFTPLFCDESIANFLNNIFFKKLGVSLPAPYISILWDTHSAIAAFRYNLLTLISLAVLCISDNGKALVVHFFLAVYAIFVFIFGDFINGGSLFSGDVIFMLNSNGTLFIATFVLCWYGSLPLKRRSQIITGVLCAIIVFFVTGCQISHVGLALSVLLINFICMFMQYIENKTDFLYTKSLLEQAR